jgi:23S rRNA pseudouridine1911/1915/1917 synthase
MGVSAGEPSAVRTTKRYLKEKYRKPGNVFVGVVSRLDAPVSGVLVFARTSKAAARLSEQFKHGTVEKLYWALVKGGLDPPTGEWNDYLLKDEAAHRMRLAAAHQKSAQRATLEYRTLATKRTASLVEIRLGTGRKHQIRVQFSSRGYPILGDRKYGGAAAESFPTGIALHARRLALEHPTKRQSIAFEAPIPAHWPRWVNSYS